jgi:hypothetical protein
LAAPSAVRSRKDKTFFFVSYSRLRQEETYYRNTAVVPTALERAGDFSQSSRKPNDPLTGLPFPGNIIPASRFDIAAKTIQDKYVPASNLPNSFYEVRAPDPLQTDETTLKLDHPGDRRAIRGGQLLLPQRRRYANR